MRRLKRSIEVITLLALIVTTILNWSAFQKRKELNQQYELVIEQQKKTNQEIDLIVRESRDLLDRLRIRLTNQGSENQ